MAETLRLTPHETVTIRESSPELLEVEGIWGPGGKAPPVHYHPAQDEHFEVLEGTLTARVEGEERELVDQARHLFRRDVGGGELRRLDLQVADRLAARPAAVEGAGRAGLPFGADVARKRARSLGAAILAAKHQF